MSRTGGSQARVGGAEHYFRITHETARRLPFRCYTKGSDLGQSQQEKIKTSEICESGKKTEHRKSSAGLFERMQYITITINLSTLAKR